MESLEKSYETGQQKNEYPPKVKAMFEAVLELFASGREPGTLKVEEITKKAGIGKGTAYEYFSSKEEIVVGALNYGAERYMNELFELLNQGKNFGEVIMECLDILETVSDAYHGYMLVQQIARDRELTGNDLLDEMEKHRDSCQRALELRNRFVELALADENISETDHYKVENAIVSQFAAYAAYLVRGDLFSEVEREQAKRIAYENIWRLLSPFERIEDE